ncbi:Uu.00g042460.m01.CDS01 [Anthostomella pinea]|uniref:Uu.00g042460.m01.CDS01 n=1 Tax=Anthostomella pinea TaxID=933095 RepID=A0AAI8YE93_9PEZI|nr:Uu.00g042460.m01.CDS01 [Anthostomella pinea]
MISSILLTGLLAAASTASASTIPTKRSTGVIQCPIILNGLVATTKTPTDFDSYATSPFNPDYIRGSEAFSTTLKFPNVTNSRFDNATYKAVEVTIDDASIFQEQNGFRRAGLQIQGDTNTDGPGTTGVRTLHWSVKQDAERALNLTHEYLNVWHETSDYSANQFNFEAGTIIGTSGSDKNNFKILNRQNTLVWSTTIDASAWQNFAVTLDFDKNTLQVYYSTRDEPLAAVTTALANDNSGDGQYQIGILKKPTGTSDVVNSGYQETGIDEGQIYGGLFLEDSASGCISL